MSGSSRAKKTHKLSLCLITIALIVTSCSPPVTPTAEPAATEAPQAEPTEDLVGDTTFTREVIDPEMLPDAVAAESSVVEIETDEGDVIVEEVMSAAGPTNGDGIVAFEDSTMNVIVPVVVRDEQGNPVPGAGVRYLSTGDLSIIVIESDGEIAPQIALLWHDDLLEGMEEVSDAGTGGRLAEPARIAPIVVGIVIIVKAFIAYGGLEWIALALTIHTAEEYNEEQESLASTDPPSFYDASLGSEYICVTPEYISTTREGAVEVGSSFVFALMPAPIAGHGAATETANFVLMTGAENVAGSLGENSATAAIDTSEPLLFRRHIMPEEIDAAAIDAWEKKSGESVTDIIWAEPVGNCAYVPDLIDRSLQEARAELEALGIQFDEEYVNSIGEPVEEAPISGTVYDQEPVAERSSGGITAPNLFPIGLPEGEGPRMVIRIVDNIPVEETATPVPTPRPARTSTPGGFPTVPSVMPTNTPGGSGALISFTSESGTVDAGDCTTLIWDLEGISAVYLDGAPVEGHGTREVCPAATTTYRLEITHTDGSTETRTVTIAVNAAPAASNAVRISSADPPSGANINGSSATISLNIAYTLVSGNGTVAVDIRGHNSSAGHFDPSNRDWGTSLGWSSAAVSAGSGTVTITIPISIPAEFDYVAVYVDLFDGAPGTGTWLTGFYSVGYTYRVYH